MSLNGICIPDVSCSDICHNINVFKSSIILYIKNIKKTQILKCCLKVVPYTSGKIWSARLIFFIFFGSVFEYIHCNKYQNFSKVQPTDSEL
jgi:hypothetical protein